MVGIGYTRPLFSSANTLRIQSGKYQAEVLSIRLRFGLGMFTVVIDWYGWYPSAVAGWLVERFRARLPPRSSKLGRTLCGRLPN